MTEPRDDWDETILRYLDGQLGEDLEKEVRERLLSDEGARARFVTLACQQQAFADLLSESAVEKNPAPSQRHPRTRGRSFLPVSRKSDRPLGFRLVAAAAVLLAATGLAILLTSRPDRGKRHEPSVAREQGRPDPQAEERAQREEALLREERRRALAEIEARRRQAEAELVQIERQKGQLLQEREKAQQEEARRQADEELRRNEARRKAAEELVEKANAEERKVEEGFARAAPPTRSAAATLERSEGEVSVLVGGTRKPMKAGEGLPEGAGLEIGGAGSRAVLRFQDGTRLELGAQTAIEEVYERDAPGGPGKRLRLGQAMLAAQVTKQPASQPMVFATPHGEARVMGTTLRIVVDSTSTRLEVTEGKVRLTRAQDKKSVEVLGGHFAVAAVGLELKPTPTTQLGLVGHWRFDEGAGSAVQDASGHGHHGTLSGPARRVAGRIGQALELDGISAEVPHSESLNPEASPWTVAAWIRKTDGGVGTVVFKDDGNFSRYYYLAVSSKPRFSISTGTRDLSAVGSRDINDGKWHHVAGVRSGAQALQIYVDGILEGTGADARFVSPAIGTSSPLKIGVGPLLPGLGPFKGWLDDVRIYNRALSAEEIKAIFFGR